MTMLLSGQSGLVMEVRGKKLCSSIASFLSKDMYRWLFQHQGSGRSSSSIEESPNIFYNVKLCQDSCIVFLLMVGHVKETNVCHVGTYQSPDKRRERIRGGGDKIKFIDIRFKR